MHHATYNFKQKWYRVKPKGKAGRGVRVQDLSSIVTKWTSEDNEGVKEEVERGMP